MDTIAGYRILRKLGTGSTANVYLGYPETSVAAGVTGSIRDDEASQHHPVALKVFHSDTARETVDIEARVLSDVTSAHIVQLLDVATLPDERAVFVLQHLGGGSLTQLLEHRERIRAGEAVTILAPIVQATASLNAAGFVHTRLSSARILFDERGTPVLSGIGHCNALSELTATGTATTDAIAHSQPERDLLVRQTEQLAIIAGEVLSRVESEGTSGTSTQLLDWLQERVNAPRLGLVTRELEDRLFDFSEPAPLEASDAAPPAGPGTSIPLRLSPRADAGTVLAANQANQEEAEDSPPLGRRRAWLVPFHIPAGMLAALERNLDSNPLTALLNRWRKNLAKVKRPIWVGTGIAVILLVVALTALPQAGQAQEGQAQEGREYRGSEVRVEDGESRSPNASPGPSDPVASPSVVRGIGTDIAPEIAAADAKAIAGDDPVAAVEPLLLLRAGCLSAASVICLDNVDQPESSLLDADRYRVRQVQHVGHESDPDHFADRSAVLIERTGGVALLAMQTSDDDSKPVSVLLVKGETGWRLRELFDY